MAALADTLQTMRESLTWRRSLVALGVAGTMGVVEWLGLGHPLGLVFGLAMGLLALIVAPLPWLLILPWGLRRSLLETLARAGVVLLLSGTVVVGGFVLYFLLLDLLAASPAPLVWRAYPHLSAWSSVVISIPLFTAAGWGLARHLELERRLEVHDVRELRLRAALEQARLLALRARLDPHFLFNALNLVTELCREDPPEAERCVLRLSSLLRAALEHAEASTLPLRQELDLCVDYLDLCQARFGDRLHVDVTRAAAVEETPVPPLAVQVLCENAVRHGIERQAAGGTVRITTAADNDTVVVTVTSPGALGEPRPGGVGLDLTRRRLALTYGEAASLTVATSGNGDETTAILKVPRGAGS